MTFSRRAVLRHGAQLGVLGAATALAACTVTTSGTTTTLTLDVAKVKTYGQAGLNAAATVMGFLAPIPALAPYAAGVQAACAGLSKALDAFSAAVGPALAVSYDDATCRTLVNSILSDMGALSSAMTAAIQGSGTLLSATVGADATTALNALDTLIDLFRGVLGLAGDRARASPRMTEAQALAVLGE
ncbi:hypothetical protein K2X14_10290 [Acetobacter sp. TBRC 12305]|uniref:Lipoprotein n=1 Tax=Acetobacter garciniae TaxID=2817435 RepID=A0A939KQW8_9PROT|nr:hypothetical protein [Acetobacter garciniae]MBO1326034.1 hypothetical protein [Acetobacter garciniae]MBX0345222.1 hypothetical protein [Acetobacter garciniae]